MISRRLLTSVFTIGVLLSVISSIGCSEAGSGKIPITTSSAQAREYFLQGLDLSEKLRGQEAREYFELAVAEDPEFALAHLNLAFVQTNNRQFVEELVKARSLVANVSRGEQLLIYGAEAGNNGEQMKQRELYEELALAYPDDERAHGTLGNMYFGQQEYALAIEHYNLALKINPDFSQPHNQLGYSYRFLKEFDKAKEAFLQYINLIPDDPNPYDSYGELLLKAGNFEESIEWYEKAIAIDSTFLASYAGVATNLILQGKHEKARQRLQAMYDHATSDGGRRGALFNRALTYIDEGSPEKAMRVFDERFLLAEKINDAAGMAADRGLVARALLENDQPDKAMEYYSQSLRIMKESDLPKQNRDNAKRAFLANSVMIAVNKGDLEKAKALASKYRNQIEVLQNIGLTRFSHQLNGMIALAEKNYDLAIEELEQANQQNSYNLYRLALAYQGNGDLDRARQLCHEAAHYNQVTSLSYSLVRRQALRLLSSLGGS